MKSLADRAEQRRASYRAKEASAGSGFHDSDRHIVRHDDLGHSSNRLIAPQNNGQARASECVIAFFDHEEEVVHFAGPDATKVSQALKSWHEAHAKLPVSDMDGTTRNLVYKILPRITLADDDGTPLLTIKLSVWNDVLFALQQQKVGLCGCTFDPSKTGD